MGNFFSRVQLYPYFYSSSCLYWCLYYIILQCGLEAWVKHLSDVWLRSHRVRWSHKILYKQVKVLGSSTNTKTSDSTVLAQFLNLISSPSRYGQHLQPHCDICLSLGRFQREGDQQEGTNDWPILANHHRPLINFFGRIDFFLLQTTLSSKALVSLLVIWSWVSLRFRLPNIKKEVFVLYFR